MDRLCHIDIETRGAHSFRTMAQSRLWNDCIMNERIWVLTKTESDLSRLSDRIRRKSVEKSSGRSSKTSAKLCQHGVVCFPRQEQSTYSMPPAALSFWRSQSAQREEHGGLKPARCSQARDNCTGVSGWARLRRSSKPYLSRICRLSSARREVMGNFSFSRGSQISRFKTSFFTLTLAVFLEGFSQCCFANCANSDSPSETKDVVAGAVWLFRDWETALFFCLLAVGIVDWWCEGSSSPRRWSTGRVKRT